MTSYKNITKALFGLSFATAYLFGATAGFGQHLSSYVVTGPGQGANPANPWQQPLVSAPGYPQGYRPGYQPVAPVYQNQPPVYGGNVQYGVPSNVIPQYSAPLPYGAAPLPYGAAPANFPPQLNPQIAYPPYAGAPQLPYGAQINTAATTNAGNYYGTIPTGRDIPVDVDIINDVIACNADIELLQILLDGDMQSGRIHPGVHAELSTKTTQTAAKCSNGNLRSAHKFIASVREAYEY